MNLTNKNILLISPESWSHIFVSKHHYAIYLARRNNKVFFLGPPADRTGIEMTQYQNVIVVYYQGFPKGLRFYPSVLQKKTISRVFNSLQSLCLSHFDIVWSFDNSVFFDFSALPGDVFKISHIVDLNQNFQTRRSASSADVCLCTSELIRRRLRQYSKHVFKINHGFHIPDEPREFESVQKGTRLRAVYAGNLSIAYIDWALLAEVVKSHAGIDFFFIGPNANVYPKDRSMALAKKEVLASINCFFVGRVNADDLLAYYQTADLLLVAYQARYREEQSNPHKIMEYLGSGKIIVASYSSEYLDLEPLILVAQDDAEWLSRFEDVLKKLDFYNSEELMLQRRIFALNNSYDRHIDEIERIVMLRFQANLLKQMRK